MIELETKNPVATVMIREFAGFVADFEKRYERFTTDSSSDSDCPSEQELVELVRNLCEMSRDIRCALAASADPSALGNTAAHAFQLAVNAIDQWHNPPSIVELCRNNIQDRLDCYSGL